MFVSFNDKIVNSEQITMLVINELVSNGYINVYFKDNSVEKVSGPEAFNLVMDLCPNALEGKQAKYHKHAWAIHNLVGHPMMQILAWLHLTQLGLKIHDMTVPNPKVLDEE